MVDTDDTRRTIHDGRRTTPRVWHKLPTGELKKHQILSIQQGHECFLACHNHLLEQIDAKCLYTLGTNSNYSKQQPVLQVDEPIIVLTTSRNVKCLMLYKQCELSPEVMNM